MKKIIIFVALCFIFGCSPSKPNKLTTDWGPYSTM